MDYQLAKSLKDTGIFHGLKCDLPGHDHTNHWLSGECRFRSPTLEELVEACAGGTKHFTLEHKMGRFHGWQAGVGATWTEKRYATCTEAVARLWIALNPPNKK